MAAKVISTTFLEIDKKYLGHFGHLPRRKDIPTAIVIHHTCTQSPKKTRSVLKSKRYSTHYEVDRDGTIYQYADPARVASHCKAANACAIGIDATHMEGAEFPTVQVESVCRLVRCLCAKYNISRIVKEKHDADHAIMGIYPHRALGVTKCPDNFPMERIQEALDEM